MTLKDVKECWGAGQGDILPVAQFEKLWGDMMVLPEVAAAAFEFLERALPEKCPIVPMIHIHGDWFGLTRDPRLAVLLRKLKLGRR